ncbi:hypothetical protein HDU93_005440, partial [Gonapodya sp. JEL0774]
MSYQPFLDDSEQYDGRQDPARRLPSSGVRRTAGTVRQMLDPRAVFNRVFSGEGGFEALPTTEAGGGFSRRGQTKSMGFRPRGERKTFSKPERLNTAGRISVRNRKLIEKTDIFKGPWPTFARVLTICCPNVLLSSVGGMKDFRVRQAWREKVALCFVVFCISAVVVFFTLVLKELLCSAAKQTEISRTSISVETFNTIVIAGSLYDKGSSVPEYSHMFENLPPGFSVSDQFTQKDTPSCAALPDYLATNPVLNVQNTCYSQGGCLRLDDATAKINLTMLGSPTFTWSYLYRNAPRIQNFIVLNNAVLDLNPYLLQYPNPDPTNDLDTAL